MNKIDFQPIGHRNSIEDSWAVLNGDMLARAPLRSDPYDFIFAKDAIRSTMRSSLIVDAPVIGVSGSVPLAQLSYGPTFQALVDDLGSLSFRKIVERKFNLDLRNRPTVVSVRGRISRSLDGYVHEDLADKIISVILYLNETWEHPNGRLRILRSRSLEDYAVEIPPEFGNILIFRRSNRSWHGHLPYEGLRLSLQFNWTYSANRSNRYWLHKFNFLNILTRPFSRLIRG
jgi:SM-20-related protein